MNLTALPAFVDNCLWMLDGDAPAIVVDPGEPGPVAEALDAPRLELAAILMTQRRAARSGDIARTAGHIAFLGRTGRASLLADGGDRLARAGSCQPRGSAVPAALRTWKNDFR